MAGIAASSSQGSFPGPVDGGYVVFNLIKHADLAASGSSDAVVYMPFNFKLIKACFYDSGITLVTGLTQSIFHTPVANDAANSTISKYDTRILQSGDYDAARNANGYWRLGRAVVSGETELAGDTTPNVNMLVPKDSFLRVRWNTAIGDAITAPYGCVLVGYPYGHAYDDPADD